MNNYLIDTSSFIEAKDKYYDPQFAEAFWDFLLEGNKQRYFLTIDKVKAELTLGNDFLTDFINQFDFIYKTSEIQIMQNYAEIINFAQINWHPKAPKPSRDKALSVFSNLINADAFLLATAKTYNLPIVTSEISNPNKQSNIKIPDIAKQLDIEVVALFDLPKRYAGKNFVFKP